MKNILKKISFRIIEILAGESTIILNAKVYGKVGGNERELPLIKNTDFYQTDSQKVS